MQSNSYTLSKHSELFNESPQALYTSVSMQCAYSRRPNKYDDLSYACMVSVTNEFYFLLVFCSFKSCNELTLDIQFMLQLLWKVIQTYICEEKWQNVSHFSNKCLRWQDVFSFLGHVKSQFHCYFITVQTYVGFVIQILSCSLPYLFCQRAFWVIHSSKEFYKVNNIY